MKLHYKYFLLASGLFWMSICSGQIYTAKQGAFIVFHDPPVKNQEVSLRCNGEQSGLYTWPANNTDFINAYRKAEQIFPANTMMSDEDLKKLLQHFEENPKQGPAYTYSPSLLIALGQATYVEGERNLKSCEIEINSAVKTLSHADHLTMARQNATFETSESEIRHVRLEIHFPKNTWIDSARVFKKIVGGNDSVQIYPYVFTTQLQDRIEMHIRDTTDVIGEFLYTIQPIDQLGNIHAPLKEVYGHNYNERSAPRITGFDVVAGDVNNAIRLSWDCTVRQRVRSFEIYRAPEHTGPFRKIASLPPSDSIYIDHLESVMRNFYYYVQIVDQLGGATKSTTNFVTPHVKEIPAPPFDLTAVATKNGVRVQWPVLDGLYNVRGYYVYRKAPGEKEWRQVSPFIPKEGQTISFIDSSRLESHIEYLFAVRSESTSYELSDYSRTAASRPGVARNVASPTGFAYRHLDDGSLMLFWDDVRKSDPFIESYHLYTADANGKPVKKVDSSPLDVSHNFWNESTGAQSPHGYVLQAEDSWGNKSAFTFAAKPTSVNYALSPGVILAHPSKTGYKLSWGLPDHPAVKSIQLYEVVNEKNTLLQSLKPTIHFYEVPGLTANQSRTFFLKYKLTDGTETSAGDVVIISK